MNKYENVLKYMKNNDVSIDRFNAYNDLKISFEWNDSVDVKFEELKEEEQEKLITFILKTFFKDEEHIDLQYITDKAVEFYKEILKDEITTWQILDECYKF